jgi:hypothetical protein
MNPVAMIATALIVFALAFCILGTAVFLVLLEIRDELHAMRKLAEGPKKPPVRLSEALMPETWKQPRTVTVKEDDNV